MFIAEASEAYRVTANRGALIFFLMNDLFRIHTFYKFSLESFLVVVTRAINMVEEGKLVFDAPKDDEEAEKEDGEGEEKKPDEKPKEEKPDEGEGE